MQYFIILILFIINNLAWANEHIIVVDAGSTGSRVHVYAYEQNHSMVKLKEIYQEKTKPGLSSFQNNPEKAAESLLPMLNNAAAAISENDGTPSTTRLSILATAGMRFLAAEDQQRIYQSLQLKLQSTPFILAQLKTISGVEEGVYDWIAVNDLNRTLNANNVGVLDMGGASTQIAVTSFPFANIYLTLGKQKFPLFVHSFLGLGFDRAKAQLENSSIEQVCYPSGYDYQTKQEKKIGDYQSESCNVLTQSLVYEYQVKEIVPQISPRIKFIAINGYYYMNHFLNPKGTSPQKLKNNLEQFCHLSWGEMKKAYPNVNPQYLSNYCFQGNYILSLFGEQAGINIKSGQQISYRDKIDNTSISWTHGAAIYDLVGSGL